MKKLGLLLLIVLLGTTVSMAQRRGGDFDPVEMAKKQSEQLKKQLKLNDKQEQKVYDLTLKSSKEMMKLREESGGNRDVMRAKMKKIREGQTSEMKNILTKEQFTGYKKYLEERRSGRSGGQRGGGQR